MGGPQRPARALDQPPAGQGAPHFSQRPFLVPVPGLPRGSRSLRPDSTPAVAPGVRRSVGLDRSGPPARPPAAGRVGERQRRRVRAPDARRNASGGGGERSAAPGHSGVSARPHAAPSAAAAAGLELRVSAPHRDRRALRLDRAAAPYRRDGGPGRLRDPTPSGGGGRAQPADDRRGDASSSPAHRSRRACTASSNSPAFPMPIASTAGSQRSPFSIPPRPSPAESSPRRSCAAISPGRPGSSSRTR